MSIKRVWKYIIVFFIILIFLPGIAILLLKMIPKPPEAEVEYARLVISQAGHSEAATYSRKLYSEAKALYDSAMVNWQKENKRFIYARNYDKVARFADLSARKAEQAVKVSRNNVTDLNIKLRYKIDTLNNLVTQIDKTFSSYPLSPDVWNRISKGKMLLKESEVAFKKRQFAAANKKITDSEILLTDSYNIATTNLKKYFNNFPTWKGWVDRTIKESKENQNYSIIIDKYSRKCLVYFGGIKKFEYNVELGKNWVGDKRIKGDKATPEGMYRITRKFGSNKTKYHKALLINYPNEIDKEEFRQEIKRGTLPKSAKIGGLIEIHGDGGRGIDWTEGCIALTNAEMDVVFKLTSEGTPVTIVGSTVTLDKLID